jgi:hypothetical protein
MGSTVASECLSEHMTAPNPLSYQLVTASWRLVAEVLILLANASKSPMGAVVGHTVARWVSEGLIVHDALCQQRVSIEAVGEVVACIP